MVRLTFQKATNLGVLYNAYLINEPVTIPQGENQQITVYNGDKVLPVTFTVAISKAAMVSAVMGISAAVVASTLA